MIHVYFGNGKGKSTAATGLALRMSGTGGTVLFCRFLKNCNSGELCAFNGISGIQVFPCGEVQGFLPLMDAVERDAVIADQRAHFFAAAEKAINETHALVVLDEALWLVHLNIISEGELLDVLRAFPRDRELVLTGGCITDAVLAAADYATEMRAHAHPYEHGVCARRGVEF